MDSERAAQGFSPSGADHIIDEVDSCLLDLLDAPEALEDPPPLTINPLETSINWPQPTSTNQTDPATTCDGPCWFQWDGSEDLFGTDIADTFGLLDTGLWLHPFASGAVAPGATATGGGHEEPVLGNGAQNHHIHQDIPPAGNINLIDFTPDIGLLATAMDVDEMTSINHGTFLEASSKHESCSWPC